MTTPSQSDDVVQLRAERDMAIAALKALDDMQARALSEIGEHRARITKQLAEAEADRDTAQTALTAALARLAAAEAAKDDIIKEANRRIAEAEHFTEAAQLDFDVLSNVTMAMGFDRERENEHNLHHAECAFCREEGPRTPEGMTAHMERCEKHPLRATTRALAAALVRERELRELVRAFRALNRVPLDNGSTVPWVREFTRIEREMDAALSTKADDGPLREFGHQVAQRALREPDHDYVKVVDAVLRGEAP